MPRSCWAWPMRKASRMWERSTSSTTRWTCRPVRSGCGGCFPIPIASFRPACSCGSGCHIGDPHQSLLVSERALGSDQGKKFLYVLNDKDEVTRRDVTVGPLNDGLRVIQSGLKPGERVILSGLQRVRPGIKVNAKNIAMTGTESPATTAAAGTPAVSPGAAPVIPTGTSGMPPPPRGNLLPPANSKPAEEPRPGVKSAATYPKPRGFLARPCSPDSSLTGRSSPACCRS